MNRILFVDKLKGLAIILVVWGHCIQFCTKDDVLNNKLFELIYTFHMPFFMAISGYLSYFSISKRTLKSLIISRIKILVIPFLIWSFIFAIVFRLEFSHSPLDLFKNYIYNLPFFFWFIWTLLICFFSTVFINKKLKDSLLAYFLLFILILLLPNSFGFYYLKYMIPYFFAGYFAHKYALKNNKKIFIISSVVFVLMWYFWKYDFYIYTTYMVTSLHDFVGIYNDCYRYLAGFAGIIVFLNLAKYLPDIKLFEVLGKNTLGIYFISSFANSYLQMLGLHYNSMLYNFVYTPIVSVFVIAVCVVLSTLISKNKLANQYFLGGR